MNRRDLLKRAAVVPAAALGTLLASSTPAEAASLFGTLSYIEPGGFGPESLNGGDIVVSVIENGTQTERFALVDKKTKIYITGQKVKYRTLLYEVYTNHLELVDNLQGANVIVTFKSGFKAKQIDIGFNI